MTIPFFAPEEIFRFFLLLAPISAVLLTSPFLNSQAVPSHLKILFIVLLSFTLYPILRVQQVLMPQGPVHLGLLLLGESLIGFTGQILFAALQLGGTLRETQMGLRLANKIDPNNGQ